MGYILILIKGGNSSEVERQLPKLNVVGSIPISRSKITPWLVKSWGVFSILECVENVPRSTDLSTENYIKNIQILTLEMV